MRAHLTRLPVPPAEAGDAWAHDAVEAAPDGAAVVAARPMSLGVDTGLVLVVAESMPTTPPATQVLVGAQWQHGPGTDPTVCQLVEFDGPRSLRWRAAEERAHHHRIWPAVKDLPGTVSVLRGPTPEDGVVVVVLARSAEDLAEAGERLLSTRLLPGEDPALLTEPDRLTVFRIVHARLPQREELAT